jgi:dinB family protein
MEAFPEKDLFTFSIGGMRPFSEMVKEFIGIWDYILAEALKEQHISLFEQDKFPATKTELLALRDQVLISLLSECKMIQNYGQEISPYQMKFSVAQWILYIIENETHHRGQGYVYLRALGIQPPFFWKRGSFK